MEFFISRANGWAGQAQTNGGASRNRDTKNSICPEKTPRSGEEGLPDGRQAIVFSRPAGGVMLKGYGQKFPFPHPSMRESIYWVFCFLGRV